MEGTQAQVLASDVLPGEVGGARVFAFEAARCALCGARLDAGALRYRLLSPYAAEGLVTACYACSRAVLGEGYRRAG